MPEIGVIVLPNGVELEVRIEDHELFVDDEFVTAADFTYVIRDRDGLIVTLRDVEAMADGVARTSDWIHEVDAILREEGSVARLRTTSVIDTKWFFDNFTVECGDRPW